jgi:hypothetical protein
MKPVLPILMLLSILLAGICIAGCTTSTQQNVPAAPSSVTPVPATPGNIPLSPADYPDMRGTWISDDGSLYFLNATVQNLPAGQNTWVFNSQNGKGISGYKSFPWGGSTQNQTIAGIFDPDGKTIYFIDQPGGWATGSLLDPDTLSVTLMNPGGYSNNTGYKMVLSMTLHRQK